MKNYKFIYDSPFLRFCGIIILVMLVGCDKKKETAVAATKYDGTELFRQIMFTHSDATAKVPELKRVRDLSGADKLEEKQLKVVHKIEEAIITEIKRSSPDFFSEFGALVQSGDPIKVQYGLKLAGDEIVKTLVNNNANYLPLLYLKFNEKLYADLSPEQKEKLKKIRDLGTIDLSELKDAMKEFTDPQNGLIIYEALNQIKNLNLNLDRQLDRQLTRIIDKQLSRVIDKQVSRVVDKQLTKVIDKQLARVVDKQIDLSLARVLQADLDLYAGSDVWVSTDYVVAAYVAVAVVAIAVVNVIDFTPMPNPEFGDQIFFQEQLVANITKQYALTQISR